MLRIRTGQMEAFNQAQLKRVDADLARYAKARFPSEAQRLSPAELQAKVTATRERCQAHGFQSTEAFALGVDFAYLYGDDWFDAPWAASMLKAEMLPESVRIEVLRKSKGVEQS